MRVVVVTPPEPVVSLEEAKLHLRVDGDGEDTRISSMIEAATTEIDGPDGWLGRALSRQTLCAFPAPCDWRLLGDGRYGFELPYPPTRSQDAVVVTAVSYTNSAGDTVGLVSGQWTISSATGAMLTSALSWGAADLAITYETGTPIPAGQSLAPIDSGLREGIFLRLTTLYGREPDPRAAEAAERAYDRSVNRLRIWRV